MKKIIVGKKDNKNMESLTNIYIIEVLDERLKPTEDGCKLTNIGLEKAIDSLPLPYHKKALEEYFEYINKNKI